MINLETRGIMARWFLWSCEHLPFTTARYAEIEDGKEVHRDGSYYVERGTTLCHIFWAILWMPIICTAVVSWFAFMLGILHVMVHKEFMARNPDAGPVADIASYFLLEAYAAGAALLVVCMVLAIIGGSKTGFFTLLWQYLKGVKQRICPLVSFGGESV